jgi:hypothetical protein
VPKKEEEIDWNERFFLQVEENELELQFP